MTVPPVCTLSKPEPELKPDRFRLKFAAGAQESTAAPAQARVWGRSRKASDPSEPLVCSPASLPLS